MAAGNFQTRVVPANYMYQLIRVIFKSWEYFPLFTLFSPSPATQASTGQPEARQTRGVRSGVDVRVLERVGLG